MSEPIKLRLKQVPLESGELEDVVQIQAALLAMGFEVEHHDIANAYREYSEDWFCAQWMGLEGTEGVGHVAKKLVKDYLEEIGERD